MPNIEIHGITFSREFLAQISLIFGDWSCAKDMVITAPNSIVTDLQGKPQPFIRVWDTDAQRGEKIARRLRLEGFDVELPVQLAKFLAKPLYTIKEVAEEMHRIYPMRTEFCEQAFDQLLAGESTRAIFIFTSAIMDMQAEYSNVPEPHEADLRDKIEAPRKSDDSVIANWKRRNRWHQMLAILSG